MVFLLAWTIVLLCKLGTVLAAGNSDPHPFDYLLQWGIWIFTFLLVVVGALQAWWLRVTWKAVQKQGIAQNTAERAWIIISPEVWDPKLLPMPPAGPAPWNVFQVSIKNIGRTPAHLTKIAVRYRNLDKSQFENPPEEPEYGMMVSLQGLILVPKDSYGLTVPLEPRSVLTDEDIRLIHTAKSFLYFYAFVAYVDVFGGTHETRVGLVYDFPQGGLVSFQNPSFQRRGSAAYNRAT
jgi:hypothetical protein